MRIKIFYKSIFLLFLSFNFFNGSVFAASQEEFKKAGKFNESATVKMSQGDLDGAESDLLSALEYSVENPKLKKNLGVVYYEKGARAIKSGNFYDAEKYLKSALQIEPENERYSRGFAG